MTTNLHSSSGPTEAGADVALVDFVAAPGDLFGRVARLLWGHASPTSRRNETRLSLFYRHAQARICLRPIRCRIAALPQPRQRSARQCGLPAKFGSAFSPVRWNALDAAHPRYRWQDQPPNHQRRRIHPERPRPGRRFRVATRPPASPARCAAGSVRRRLRSGGLRRSAGRCRRGGR